MPLSVLTLRRRAYLWLPPVVYVVAIFQLSSQPDPLPALTASVCDKALHTIEYAGLAALFCRALTGEGLGLLPATALTIVLVSGYGASDEWHQYMCRCGTRACAIGWPTLGLVDRCRVLCERCCDLADEID
jgi:hypothetical protein